MGSTVTHDLRGYFAILIVFSYIAILLLYPINPFEMSLQLMFPVLFFGNLTFYVFYDYPEWKRNGCTYDYHWHCTDVFSNMNSIERSFWNILLNPFRVPDNFHPMIWEGILIKIVYFFSPPV